LRKTAAILFILVLAFNLCGYRFVISLLQQKADSRLESRIDNNEYDESQLVEMRVQLDLPYQTRFTDFERHYGEIVINGKAYTYVKRKMEGDVLVLKCIANESKQQLSKTADNLARTNSGQDQENNGKKQTAAVKTFSGDFDDKNQFCNLDIAVILNRIHSVSHTASLADVLILTPHQPPRAVLVS
jgi:hypothetical protein